MGIPSPKDPAVTWKAQDRIIDGETVVVGTFKAHDRDALTKFTAKLEAMGIQIYQSTMAPGSNWVFQVNGGDLTRNGISFQEAEVRQSR